ncbi:MAG: PilN domain-containing protein [Pirellulaceae bacterium]|nr:PilN domain-containing protein [Pirellulaceae bacterium]
MKSVNLIPLKLRQRWEWQSQAITWALAWSIIAIFLWITYTIFEQRHAAAKQQLVTDQTFVSRVSEATSQIQQLTVQSTQSKTLVENAQLLELTDVPLALLQTLVECCQLQVRGIQIDSIRLDEIAPSTIKENVVTPARKQLLFNGVAESDPRATSFVNSLQASGQFAVVELLSITGSEDRPERSFSIRCEQKQ